MWTGHYYNLTYTVLIYHFQRCFIDYRTKAGRTLGQVVGIFELVTFGTLAICYGAIWVKVRQSSKVLDSNVERCNRTAKIMMLFVVTFFFQWWSQMLIVIWAYIFVTIPPFIPIISGTLVSLGGVYDCIVYTVIRRKFQKRVSPTWKSFTMGSSPRSWSCPAISLGKRTTIRFRI